MKNIYVLLAAMLLISVSTVKGQTSQADQLSLRIAQKMKDSLQLNTSQRDQLYQINRQISLQKSQTRNYSANKDSVRVQVQQIENGRDGLYKPVLGEEKYHLYLQKKQKLISWN